MKATHYWKGNQNVAASIIKFGRTKRGILVLSRKKQIYLIRISCFEIIKCYCIDMIVIRVKSNNKSSINTSNVKCKISIQSPLRQNQRIGGLLARDRRRVKGKYLNFALELTILQNKKRSWQTTVISYTISNAISVLEFTKSDHWQGSANLLETVSIFKQKAI